MSAAAVPEILKEEHKFPEYRHPIWIPRDCSAEERVQVEQTLAAIELRLLPGSRAFIETQIGRLMLMLSFADEKLTKEAIAARAEEYANNLLEFSDAHVKAAVDETIRTEKWLPKVTELRARIHDRRCTALVMRHRAQVILGMKAPGNFEITLRERLEAERKPEPVVNIRERLAELPAELAATAASIIEGAR